MTVLNFLVFFALLYFFPISVRNIKHLKHQVSLFLYPRDNSSAWESTRLKKTHRNRGVACSNHACPTKFTIIGYLMPEPNLFDIQACLLDEERTKAFVKAVRSVVRKGDIVIDAGSGSGLLGVIAAKSGARKVYCIEFDRLSCEVILRAAVENGVADKIVIVCGDAMKVELPEKADVLALFLRDTQVLVQVTKIM